ncbi:MAG: heavy-metal-associated domain-containing protein [Saprospiraceae bacterium]|nr:heavy-metal-associated domain-containing protein [Saprospiraceae bacterium]MBP7680138.1 heavy-metal-associated domain-containing protein [Saprospiraceae bacterium]
MKQSITVENIKCGGCMNSIETALMKITNVENVSIDKDTDTVIVDGVVERESLIQALSNLGYPEKGNNNLLKKAKSYVSCVLGRI